MNGDTNVSPVDVLWVITYLNTAGSGPTPAYPEIPPPYYDVSGDGNISPIDVVLVITYLNSEQSGDSEGEAEPLDVITSNESVRDFAVLPQSPLAETTIVTPLDHTPISSLAAPYDEDLLPRLKIFDLEAITGLWLSRQGLVKRGLEELFQDTDLDARTDFEDLLEVMADELLRRR